MDLKRTQEGRREGDIPIRSAKLHDPGKPAFRRLGILPQQLRMSGMSLRCRKPLSHNNLGRAYN